MTTLQIKLLSLPILALINFTTLALILGLKPSRRWLRAVAVVGAIGFMVRAVVFLLVLGYLEKSIDFQIFWQMGSAAAQGLDPYDPARLFVQPMLYPPNTPPVMAVFGALEPRVGYILWVVLNLLTGVALGFLARRSLLDSETTDLGPEAATVVGLTLVMTSCGGSVLDVGQMALLVVGWLLLSVALRQANRPVLAGIFLALGSIKPTLSVPMLVLFNRRKDRLTWVTLVGVTLLLVGITSAGFVRLPYQLHRLSAELAIASAVGGVNDVGFGNESSLTIIGFDHALFRLGVEDYGLIRKIQAGGVFALGAGLSWEAWRRRYSWGARCALVGAYSPLFFYHRNYDLLMLILPMLYAAGQARIVSGRSRIAYAVVGLASLAALWYPGRFVRRAWHASDQWGELGSWAFRATILPWSTWATLVVIGALILAERRFRMGYDRRDEGGSVLV
jgi:hypothetical protein